MKTFRRIDIPFETPQQREFYDRRLDCLVRVQNLSSGVVIRTARADLPDRARESLVRYLAAEGLIPEVYRWYADGSHRSGQEVKWVVDASWVRSSHRAKCLADRVWAYLTWGRLLSLALFLAALVIALWLKPR